MIIFGVLIGFIVFSYACNKMGEQPKIGMNIYIYLSKKEVFHLHHWLISLIILFILFVTIYFSGGDFNLPIIQITIGFLIGMFLSGMKYDDKFDFIEKIKSLNV